MSAGIELQRDTRHRPEEQHQGHSYPILCTGMGSWGLSRQRGGGVKQDLYRENGPYLCCRKQVSCKGACFPFIDGAQTADLSPRTGFLGFGQAGQAQLLCSLGPTLAESSRGGLMVQESF